MLNMSSCGLTATSRIDGTDVAFFNASISFEGNGNFNITNNVHDKSAYVQNKEQVDADYGSFQTKVMELANGSMD